MLWSLIIQCSRHHRDIYSFPTRRSSDLYENFLTQVVNAASPGKTVAEAESNFMLAVVKGIGPRDQLEAMLADRKSTRLNSSHEWISYAVFCLKKKKNTQARDRDDDKRKV